MTGNSSSWVAPTGGRRRARHRSRPDHGRIYSRHQSLGTEFRLVITRQQGEISAAVGDVFAVDPHVMIVRPAPSDRRRARCRLAPWGATGLRTSVPGSA